MSSGPWSASVRRGPRDSAAKGEHVAYVNGEKVGYYGSRGEARRAADEKADELNRKWEKEHRKGGK